MAVGRLANNSFFEEATEASQIKAQIVKKYFWSWAKIVLPHSQSGRIAYIDLFAGPGRYAVSGTLSTPLLVLNTAIGEKDGAMRNALVAILNDRDEESVGALKAEIQSLPGVETLKYPPQVHNFEVGEDIVKQLEESRLIPTLCFVDPWGYKGLSLRLIEAVLKDWACECIFFFNYNRINMGLTNKAVVDHMNALFGDVRAAVLRAKLPALNPLDRELTIVEELCEALNTWGNRYILPFTFKNANGSRTSHHLFFVTKHIRGYEIMKEIMARESSSENQGVPSFEYNPATINQPLLFEYTRPIDELCAMLLKYYRGRTLTMVDVYNDHHVGRSFIKKNYKRALTDLEGRGEITANPPASKRRKINGEVTLSDAVSVTFPK